MVIIDQYNVEKLCMYTLYPPNWSMYHVLLFRGGVYGLHGNGYSPRGLSFTQSQITCDLKCSAHSNDKNTFESYNHSDVSPIALHAKT